MLRRCVPRLGASAGFGSNFDAPTHQKQIFEGPFSTEEFGGMHNDQGKFDRKASRDAKDAAGHGAVIRSNEYNEDGERAAPLPPAIPVDPIQPIDFNPHMEIFELPKEIFDPRFPFTRETNLLAFDQMYECSYEEMAHRYGLRVNVSPRAFMFSSYIIGWFLTFWLVYSSYRAQPNHKHWNSYSMAIASSGDPPTIDEDDVYLDHWMNPTLRHSRKHRWDAMATWKPLIRENNSPENSWSVKFEHRDPVEWKHMTSRN